MSITATDFQNLVIATLSDGDPTALAGLNANVPKYWLLWARFGVIPELRYWYVRRDAIRYLMACVNQQIDYMRRTQVASRNMTLSSRQDAATNAAFHETASSHADRSSSSNYSDATNSAGSGSSAGNRNASQLMSGSGSLLDNGSGSNSASQSSSFLSDSTINSSSSDSTAAQRYTNREVCGDHQRAYDATKLSGGFSIGIGTTATNTKTWETEQGTITEAQSANGVSSYTAKQDDARANSLTQTSEQSSSSSFNAHRLASDSMSSSGSSHMTASSSSSFSMSGAGSGTMTGTGTGGSTMEGGSTRAAHSDGEAHRISTAASHINSTMEKLHQRFLHLKELWTKANEMIAWLEKQRLGLTPYTLQTIAIQYPAGINADAANLLLVSTPFGLGNGR